MGEVEPVSLFCAQHYDRFAGGVLSWIEMQLPLFQPPDERTAVADDPGDKARRKAFMELGIALSEARSVPSLAVMPALERITASWVDAARGAHVLQSDDQSLSLFVYRASVLAVFRGLNVEVEIGEVRALQRVLDLGYIDRIERTAWNQLDLRYYFGRAGLSHALPSAQNLIRASSIFHRPALGRATDRDLYGITHIVFVATDFGKAQTQDLLRPCAAGLDDYLASCLAICLAEQNWDLAAEFIMCRIYRGTVAKLEEFAVASLCGAQHSSGYLPASATTAPTDDSDPAAVFTAVYHPTVVGLFLLAAAARAGR
jgi:hypothetical protein